MEGMDELDVRSVYAEDDGEVFIVAFETAAHSLPLSHRARSSLSSSPSSRVRREGRAVRQCSGMSPERTSTTS